MPCHPFTSHRLLELGLWRFVLDDGLRNRPRHLTRATREGTYTLWHGRAGGNRGKASFRSGLSAIGVQLYTVRNVNLSSAFMQETCHDWLRDHLSIRQLTWHVT